MTNARHEFINHLKLRGFSKRTIENYIKNVAQFARFHYVSPDLNLRSNFITIALLRCGHRTSNHADDSNGLESSAEPG